MKALFVDFDGVLNSKAYFDSLGLDDESDADPPLQHEKLDPAAIKILDDLLEVTGAMMVISSSWRHGRSLEELVEMLELRGFTHGPRVIGMTPWMPEPTERLQRWLRDSDRTREEIDDWLDKNAEIRGDEIQAWMDAYNAAHPHDPVEAFAILDDDEDMAHLMPRLVLTDWYQGGLELEHRDRAFRYLWVGVEAECKCPECKSLYTQKVSVRDPKWVVGAHRCNDCGHQTHWTKFYPGVPLVEVDDAPRAR